jgi:hypothetical protein
MSLAEDDWEADPDTASGGGGGGFVVNRFRF